ncbi:MAG: Ribosome maturation factor RimM [Candidatus Ordinivivax streblomastigis]|uniref:Ribosome maturation factor RimM n=1 Tax=Candidatus Ordinivivax streblomastigis TaxID=2540710 RepID=A0A5M8NY53_9BACT|nr:MAG: Ribosome maturation factor RimM [Candidatus Ordinivivax streblomastigis]
MIKKEELIKIGKFNKPHGIKGEISFTFTNDAFDEAENPFLICEMDGIFVPFRLETYRFTSDSTALTTLKTIDSEAKARLLANKEVYFSKNQVTEESEYRYSWNDFIGYTLIDEKTGKIGIISDIDTSTLNILFVVENGENEIFIPAAEELISRIDEKQKQIFGQLPEGILDL